ncbi:MAG: SDR family oxidoreductase [Zoogloeaceae bacterium]|jgi:nucleoside-diphosphate-sugar epimerase|nr:SDR family oxidoreductase [Zoogloeaceae bacterium]
MRSLLIIGCGDVLRRALPELLRHWRIYALVRERDPALTALGVTQLIGDLDRKASLRRLAGLAHAVLHAAPPPDRGQRDPRMRRLLAVLRRGSLPRRFVYISTSGVYGDCAGAKVNETRAPHPQTGRAQRRADAEKTLRRFGRNSGCCVNILRASGIYAGDRLPLARLRQGLPMWQAGEDVYTNHVHAEDLGSACLAALRHGRANRVYNASDDSDLLLGAWFDKLADAFDLPRPPRVSRCAAPDRLSFMNESRRLDNRRLKRELGFRFRYPNVDCGIAAAKEAQCSGSG